MAPVVSVVIPWSPEHTPREMLEKAKESARKQSVKTNPIIVEDTDQRGPAWARNIGMERAETQYIAFLDADDLWKPEKLRRQLDRMNETGAGVCVEGSPMPTKEFIRKLYVSEVKSITSSVLIDTSKVDVAFEETLSRKEDHLFVLEAAKKGEVCLCPELTDIRKHEEGLSATTTAELYYENSIQFRKLANKKIPETLRYNDEYLSVMYYQYGRLNHFAGEYQSAIRSFVISIRYKVRIKPFLALCLSVLGMAGLPTSSIVI